MNLRIFSTFLYTAIYLSDHIFWIHDGVSFVKELKELLESVSKFKVSVRTIICQGCRRGVANFGDSPNCSVCQRDLVSLRERNVDRESFRACKVCTTKYACKPCSKLLCVSCEQWSCKDCADLVRFSYGKVICRPCSSVKKVKAHMEYCGIGISWSCSVCEFGSELNLVKGSR